MSKATLEEAKHFPNLIFFLQESARSNCCLSIVSEKSEKEIRTELISMKNVF